MKDVVNPDVIFPDCPFKSNQRQAKISILNSLFAVWICGVMHTVEIDSKVWCTLQRLWCTPRRLTWRCDALRGDWLGCVIHTLEIVSKEFFEILCVLDSSGIWNNWLSSYMYTAKIDLAVWCTPWILTPRRDAHRRDWLRGGCTPWRLTPRWDAHRGDWLRGGMHTAKFL